MDSCINLFENPSISTAWCGKPLIYYYSKRIVQNAILFWMRLNKGRLNSARFVGVGVTPPPPGVSQTHIPQVNSGPHWFSKKSEKYIADPFWFYHKSTTVIKYKAYYFAMRVDRSVTSYISHHDYQHSTIIIVFCQYEYYNISSRYFCIDAWAAPPFQNLHTRTSNDLTLIDYHIKLFSLSFTRTNDSSRPCGWFEEKTWDTHTFRVSNSSQSNWFYNNSIHLEVLIVSSPCQLNGLHQGALFEERSAIWLAVRFRATA